MLIDTAPTSNITLLLLFFKTTDLFYVVLKLLLSLLNKTISSTVDSNLELNLTESIHFHNAQWSTMLTSENISE